MVTTLFRPIGQAELDLIEASGWRAFPPRLPMQPIFYPVLDQAYAEEIASRWNVKDEASGHVGYVVSFEVETAFVERYEVRTVGAAHHRELWVPAEELTAFNEHIVGTIRLVATFRDEG